MPFVAAHQLAKKRFLDVQAQQLPNAVSKVCLSLSFPVFTKAGDFPSYLTLLKCPHERWAFTLARYNLFPSAVLYGRFSKIPYSHAAASQAQLSLFHIWSYIAHFTKHYGINIYLLF